MDPMLDVDYIQIRGDEATALFLTNKNADLI
jgi:hypothetical protein